MNAAAILAAMNELLTLLPAGMSLWLRLKAARDALQTIHDEGRDPTPAEWDAIDAASRTLERNIDDNAARAAGVP